MKAKHLNTNRNFMLGNALLFVAVLLIVIIFIYMSYQLKEGGNKKEHFSNQYQIELRAGFKNHDYKLQINDSIIFSGKIKKDSLIIRIKQFAKENSLLIIDNKTEKLNAIYSLDKNSEKVILSKEKDVIKCKKN